MIYSNLLKKHYSDWPSLEKAIEALPTAKARGNVFEEFTFAYFTIKKQMYQIAEIYPSADIPDKYRKAFKLGNKQHQDSGVDGLDRKSTRLNSSHIEESRMPSSA